MLVATTDILIEPLRDVGQRTNQILCWHFYLKCHDSALNGMEYIYIHLMFR